MQNAPGLEPHCPDLGGWWSLGFWRARNFQTTPRGPRKPPEPGHCNPGQSAGKQRRAGWQRRQRRPESVALGSASRGGRASGPGAPPEPRRAGRGAEQRRGPRREFAPRPPTCACGASPAPRCGRAGHGRAGGVGPRLGVAATRRLRPRRSPGAEPNVTVPVSSCCGIYAIDHKKFLIYMINHNDKLEFCHHRGVFRAINKTTT
ncbi:uncharacterized protein [Manis javanica]|uniref:uncharacterized protein n=1 Tax=Manis javanica TaxID=9974 RepID=UPI003C6D8095